MEESAKVGGGGRAKAGVGDGICPYPNANARICAALELWIDDVTGRGLDTTCSCDFATYDLRFATTGRQSRKGEVRYGCSVLLGLPHDVALRRPLAMPRFVTRRSPACPRLMLSPTGEAVAPPLPSPPLPLSVGVQGDAPGLAAFRQKTD